MNKMFLSNPNIMGQMTTCTINLGFTTLNIPIDEGEKLMNVILNFLCYEFVQPENPRSILHPVTWHFT